MAFAGMRMEVRYDPDADGQSKEVLLFSGDEPLGTAKLVRFTDNAKRKRKGTPIPAAAPDETAKTASPFSPTKKEHTITYAGLKEGQ
jgi:hypothetical protein